jgi:hypothetical protein
MTNTKQLEKNYQECLKAIREKSQRLDAVLKNYPDMEAELRPRLEAALWLSEKKEAVEPRPGHLAASRRQLEARLEKEKKRHPWVAGLRSWLTRPVAPTVRLALSLALALALLANISVVNAAAKVSYPGDMLYPIKKVEEQISIHVTSSGLPELELHLCLAQRRAAEIETLVLENRYEHLPQTIRNFDNQVQQTVVLLARLEKNDDRLVSQVAAKLEDALINQANMLEIMLQLAPINNRTELRRVIQASETGLSSIRALNNPH